MAVFAPSGPAPLSTVSLQGAQVPTLGNVVCTLANTEYSYILPATTKQFEIGPRGVSTLKLAFTVGTSGVTYLAIGSGDTRKFDAVSLTLGLTLYFQSTKAGEVAEIISWA